MATNNLVPFANGSAANVTSESDWQGESLKSTLKNGFQSGIARSDRVNRAIAQGTSAGYAIGQLVADYAGQDAGIDAENLYSGFQDALEKFFKAKMFDAIYPVGSVYISASSTNPRALFGIGTWERIGEGKTLIDAGATYVAGSTGGSDTHTLAVNEMPAHSHTGTASSTGAHTHTRGTMNITGKIGAARDDYADAAAGGVGAAGAFYIYATDKGYEAGDGHRWNFSYAFDASRAWTGETSVAGTHTHAVTVENTGGGQSFSTRNPYLAVYIWKRTA